MAKIILINPPPLREPLPGEFSAVASEYFDLRDRKSPQYGDQQCEPNGGLLAIGASLEEAGFSVEIHDLNIVYVADPSRFEGELASETIENLLKRSVERAFGVGISSITITAKPALFLARLVRQWNPEAHITIGGIFPSFNPGFFLKCPDVDSVILGEGHDTCRELFVALRAKKDLPPHVVLREDLPKVEGKSTILPPPPSSIPPYPAFHLLCDYCKPSVFRFISSFGCVFGCTFCSPREFYRNTTRFREPREFASIVKSYVQEYSIDDYLIGDLTFFQDPEHSEEVCRWLCEFGVPRLARYWCQTRSDLITPRVVDSLERSGCHQVAIGVESFHQATVDALKHIKTSDRLETALRQLRSRGIETLIYLMVGIPGESMTDVVNTIEAARRLLEDGVVQHTNAAVFVPFAGLPISKEVRIIDRDPQNYAMSVYPNQWPFPVYETSSLSRFQIRALWELSLATYIQYL